ncbi:type 2 periplasmic-binding domain-containing protein [Alteromonas pelagimontana]|uniref:hypothetical protein n=1 Tax=Alteromonas pelagimontana TaxID=1858656 RepID=UPI000ADFBC1C|nr:hypothetical protein [Alteromonas pelagimontana]
MSTFRIYSQSKKILLALTIFGCAVAGFYQNFLSVPVIPPQTGQILSCPEAISTNRETFDVYVTESSIAEMALPLLCKDPVVTRQFGNVRVTIGHNDYDTFRYINHGVSHLALVKSNVVDAFDADRIYGYENIASHADYSAYFIALREKPELTKEYLFGKRIGILAYPSSRSGHIVPKTVLKSLGLQEDNVALQYYNSHKELRRALLAGEVDIISSYWGKGDDNVLSRNYITAIENPVSGMRWYLKMQTRNTDLRCEMQKLIQEIADNHPKNYYQNVVIIDRCENATIE